MADAQAELDALRARHVAALGSRFTHTLTLMNGETRRLDGVVVRVPYQGGHRITLQYRGLSFVGDDANWDTPRRHYPWVPVEG